MAADREISLKAYRTYLGIIFTISEQIAASGLEIRPEGNL